MKMENCFAGCGKLMRMQRRTHFINLPINLWVLGAIVANISIRPNTPLGSARALIFPTAISPEFSHPIPPTHYLCELFESAQKFYAHGIKSKSKLLLIWRKINRQGRRLAVSSSEFPSTFPPSIFRFAPAGPSPLSLGQLKRGTTGLEEAFGRASCLKLNLHFKFPFCWHPGNEWQFPVAGSFANQSV